MVSPSLSQTETVKIERLIAGGDGLARLASGQIVFVPWSVPGEEAVLTLPETPPETAGKKGKGVPEAKIERITAPSPDRVEPRCSVFGQCGGCQWQQVSETAQQHWKREIILESLRRIGKLPADTPVAPVIGAQPWQYRNNVRWVAEAAGNGRLTLGYYRHQSHEVVPVETCHLMDDTANAVRQWLETNVSDLRAVQYRTNTADDILLILEGELAQTGWLEPLRAAFPKITGIVAVSEKQKTVLYGNPWLLQTLAEKTFRASSGSFFQVNLPVAGAMVQTLAECLDASSEAGKKAPSLLDLYAGVGVFALLFADRFDSVIAVESSADAIEDARDNIRRQNVRNVELFAGTAKAAIRTLPSETSYDTVILDPPRAGVDAPVLDWVAQNTVRRILYVSCDPVTLARDLGRLVALGWRIDRMQPFDMFPQTHHVEAVACLSRV